MAKNIIHKNFLFSHVQKLGHWAEQKALEYFEKPEAFREEPPKSYLNAKKINFVAPLDAGGGGAKGSSERSTEGPDPLILEKLNLKMDEHFGVNVNLNTSTIHIPSFVYDRRKYKIATRNLFHFLQMITCTRNTA